MQLWTWTKDSIVCKKTINKIRIKCNLRVFSYPFKKGINTKIIINLLKKEITNVTLCSSGSKVISCLNLFGKINRHLHCDLIILCFFVIFGDHFFCVCKRIISNLKKFRMLSNTFNVLSGCFLSVSESLLDKVSRIFWFSIIIKLHSLIISQNTTPYNTLFCGFDKKNSPQRAYIVDSSI